MPHKQESLQVHRRQQSMLHGKSAVLDVVWPQNRMGYGQHMLVEVVVGVDPMLVIDLWPLVIGQKETSS